MTAYGWIIDKDHTADADDEPGTYMNAVGIVGPSDIPDDLKGVLESGKGRRFRMYDDDGELYYEGRWVGPNWACHDGRYLASSAFGPLWDFGKPNAGATEIRYQENGNNTGPWHEL